VALPTSYTMGTGSFPGVRRPRRGVDHPLLSGAKFKEKVKLSSTPHLSLHGLFWGELYLYFYFTLYMQNCQFLKALLNWSQSGPIYARNIIRSNNTVKSKTQSLHHQFKQ